MTQVNTLQPIPFYALGGENPEEPKTLYAILSFAQATEWLGDFLSQLQSKRFQGLRSIYFDCVDCANPVTLFFPETQQRIVFEAGSWGYIPVIASSQMQFRITGTAPDIFRVHFLNVDIDPVIEGSTTAVPSGDIVVTGSPVLLGRYSPGSGFAQEIPVVAPFQINGTEISVQASARYNVFGRRTAGAGAMEDSTRQQLNIAGTDLANVFNQPQIINTNATAFTPVPGNTLTMVGADATISRLATYAYGQINVWGGSRARGTLAVPTAVQTNDILLLLSGAGYGATGFGNSGQIRYVAMENWTDLVQGTSLQFFGIANGSTSPTETLRCQPGVGLSMFGANPVIDQNRLLRRRVYTFGTLPTAVGVAGAEAQISDGAAAPVWGALAAGGGAVSTPVYSDNAAWRNG